MSSLRTTIVSWLRQHRSTLAAFGVVVAAVATGMVMTNAVSLTSRPIDYAEDSLFQYGVASAVNEAGLSAAHPRLNAPFGADWRDFAIHTDLASIVEYRVLAVFSDDPIQIVNLAYAASFFVCAAAMFWALRRFDVDRWLAAGVSIGYPMLPYHFFRSIHHQFMAQYWTLPVLAVVAYQVAFDERPMRHRAPWKLAAASAVLALNGAYYTVFGAMLLSLAALVRMIRLAQILPRSWREASGMIGRSVRRPAVAFVAFGVAAVIGVAPSALARLQDGTNYRTPARSIGDGDQFGLRTTLMATPVEGHRLAPLRALSETVARLVPGGERQAMAIGAVALVGLVLSAGLVALRTVGRRDRLDSASRSTIRSTRAAALCVGFFVAALVLGSPGGLHWLGSIAGFGLIRSWGRASVVIATLSLVTLALWANGRWVRLERAANAKFWLPLLAVALGAFMVWDQQPTRTTSSQQRREYAAAKSFYGDLEAELPKDAAVFMLPVVPFPEHWVGSLLYQPIEGVFFTDTLRFSSGGIAGRQSDWQETLLEKPAELFAQLKDAGFSAAVVDRRGFGDPDAFVAEYSAAAPVLLEDSERVAFDLRGAGVPQIRRGDDLIHQPTLMFAAGFNERLDGLFPGSSDSSGGFQAFVEDADLEFRNRQDQVFNACVRFRLESAGGDRTVSIRSSAGGPDEEFRVADGEARDVALSVALAPGTTTWTFHTDGRAVIEGARRSSVRVRGAYLDGRFGRPPACGTTR